MREEERKSNSQSEMLCLLVLTRSVNKYWNRKDAKNGFASFVRGTNHLIFRLHWTSIVFFPFLTHFSATHSCPKIPMKREVKWIEKKTVNNDVCASFGATLSTIVVVCNLKRSALDTWVAHKFDCDCPIAIRLLIHLLCVCFGICVTQRERKAEHAAVAAFERNS